jgi:predicted polyphosphate/ATP-dependent NAD kinase
VPAVQTELTWHMGDGRSRYAEVFRSNDDKRYIGTGVGHYTISKFADEWEVYYYPRGGGRGKLVGRRKQLAEARVLAAANYEEMRKVGYFDE